MSFVVDVDTEDRPEVLAGQNLVARVGRDRHGGIDEEALAVVGASACQHGQRRIYELTSVPGWESYEGRLVIAWPTGSAGRSWHRKADSMLWPVLEIADQHDP